MKKRKLKKFVIPTIYLMTMTVMFLGIGFMVSNLMKGSSLYSYAVNPVTEESLPVVSTDVESKIILPINEENVEVLSYYYQKDDDEERQVNSLIYYENTYMENTGILYGSDETFNVLSVWDGVVKNVSKDNILGNVVEIENSPKMRTYYYCLNDVYFKTGDQIKQGESIGTSGMSKLETSKENILYFEVYYEGVLINPENILNIDPSEL